MSQKKCPICETNLTVPAFKPFCSKRCADVDLSRWLKGGYAIPGRPSEQADEVPGGADSSDA
ncbi:MAG: DNA gyrase inhibitor YacG [Pseudomonadota bacterium]